MCKIVYWDLATLYVELFQHFNTHFSHYLLGECSVWQMLPDVLILQWHYGMYQSTSCFELIHHKDSNCNVC